MLTLGSLFDGIGVFPLAARRQGIVPLWASEIEKAPISITKRHFPDMEHLGDITQLHGGEVPPVDVITFGSPCQNLSSAGRREGLGGVKSSLFFQAVRLIEEMRDATGGQFPTIVIWENVMGALLSGDRLDFRAVLQSLADAKIPMPASGRWANAGMVRGGQRELCWRLLDAQHWADPRLARRQRVFVVADLRACLKSSNEDGNEGKRENLSRNIKFAFTFFPKSAKFVEPAEKTLYHPAAWQNDKLV